MDIDLAYWIKCEVRQQEVAKHERFKRLIRKSFWSKFGASALHSHARTTNDLDDIRSIIGSALTRQTNVAIKPIQSEIAAPRNGTAEIYDMIADLRHSTVTNTKFRRLSIEKKLLTLNAERLEAARQVGITLPGWPDIHQSAVASVLLFENPTRYLTTQTPQVLILLQNSLSEATKQLEPCFQRVDPWWSKAPPGFRLKQNKPTSTTIVRRRTAPNDFRFIERHFST